MYMYIHIYVYIYVYINQYYDKFYYSFILLLFIYYFCNFNLKNKIYEFININDLLYNNLEFGI